MRSGSVRKMAGSITVTIYRGNGVPVFTDVWHTLRTLPTSGGLAGKGPLLDYNWLTPKAQARPAGDKGWGSFVLEPIFRGETVAAFGGWIVSREVLSTMSSDRQARSIQVDDDLYLVSGVVREPGDMLNHSCEPNCGLSGSQLLIAMRDIEQGEELTFDYAVCDASDYDEFICLCGQSTCRGVVRGTDWRETEIQDRYAGYFSPYLMKRIASLPTM